jgi:hypothetical protein
MLIKRQVLSAVAVATLALTFSAIASDAQAQFGPMGMGMMGMRGRMGMGMMGMRGPVGMGSARSIYLNGPGYGSRSSRSYRRYVEEDLPPRPAKPHAKPAPAATTARSIAPAQLPAKVATQHVESKSGVVQPGQDNRSVQTSHPVQVNQPAPANQPTRNTQVGAPVQQVQPSQPAGSTATVERASTDSALPARITPETGPRNCLTKLHLKDGTILLQDFCTLEQAVIKQGDGSQTRQVGTSPASALPQRQQPQPTPAQLARSR